MKLISALGLLTVTIIIVIAGVLVSVQGSDGVSQTAVTITPRLPLNAPFSPEGTAEPMPVDREKYSPARYGIPETLGQFEVVAVATHVHNPCAPANFVLVMLYPLEGLSDSNLNDALSEASAELKAINPTVIISMASPPEQREEFFARLDETYHALQADAAAGRCGEVFGGPSGVSGDRPVLFATPTPDLLLPESSAEASPPIQFIATLTPFR